jgi:hypothetical protein
VDDFDVPLYDCMPRLSSIRDTVSILRLLPAIMYRAAQVHLFYKPLCMATRNSHIEKMKLIVSTVNQLLFAATLLLYFATRL